VSEPGLVAALRGVVGDAACLVRPEELFVYEADALTLHRARPRAVVLPLDKIQVAQVVKVCRAHEVPFVARGAGTGLSGGALALEGAVVIECSRMNRILEVNPVDRYAVVQAGVINAELSKTVACHGLFYAPDPSSQAACTIGGNVAENSGGPHTLKYGTTTNHVLALEVVLPDGEFVTLGSRTGWLPGYDLVGAFVGCEGTLGVVTEATVRLTEIPQSVETLLAVFSDLLSACRAVGAIIGAGMIPAALEIVDQRTIAAVEASVYAAGLPTDAGAVLLIELDGPSVTVADELNRVRRLVSEAGARRVDVAGNEQERQRFWRARKGAFGAMGRLAPDLYVHDAVVPRVKLPEVLERICEIGDRYRLRLSNVFHAGDGNLHPNISFDRRDPEEMQRVVAAGEEILRACVEVGGALSGEHGIGREKRDFMGLLFSADDLDAMHRLRAAFDPDGVCNPGKVLPTPRSCVETSPSSRRGNDPTPTGP
jgi:glycolate oxidase subunit GlcD